MADVVEAQLIQMTGCLLPCTYSEYKLIGNPVVIDQRMFGLQLSFGKTEAYEEREALVYEFESFVSEGGGALGLFLGVSFLSVWDLMESVFTGFKQRFKSFVKLLNQIFNKG